ncbi:YhdP family protein [Hylemonella sp. W303a]|uniref:YhdP family protein n=1 Tax=Hylemonella sp. W303a TaxID=3389873 RepID=UPI00396B4366
MNALPQRLNLRSTLSLQAWVWLTRVVWWLVLLLGLLVCAVWAGLNFFIVPRIDSLRPMLELQATQMLGRPLRIGSIRAETEGRLLPSFELREVMLYERVETPASGASVEVGERGDASAVPVLRLPRVRVQLSLHALLRLGFDQLVIDQPDLTVRRAADGRIYIAGIEVPQQSEGDGRLADWVLSQTEWRITGGSVHWIDETRPVPPVALQGLEFRLRNGARTHEWRLDVQAPDELGGRVSLRGQLREPLFFARPSEWQLWDGELYAELERVDLDALRQRMAWPAALAHIQSEGGSAALRAWVDVEEGHISSVTADVALGRLQLKPGPDLPALDLNRLAGRLGARWGTSLGGSLQDGSYEVSTQGLRFDTRDGLVWSSGDARFSVAGYQPGQTLAALHLQDIDLAVLAGLARHLPLTAQIQQNLSRYAPRGRVERLQANWQGPSGGMPERYELEGRVAGLELAAQANLERADKTAPGLTTPGLAGITLDFEMNQDGGTAKAQVRQGFIALPGMFEPARLALDPFSADLRWRLKAGRLDSLQINNARIANADLQGDFQAEWQAPRVAFKGSNASPTEPSQLGHLDLQGSFSRLDVAKVHRYLPLTVSEPARNYLREALPRGRASQVRVRLAGDLDQFPFHQGGGEFRVTAQVQDTTFVYLPASLQNPGELPWPALQDLQGEFLMERDGLQLRNFSAAVAGAPRMQLAQSQVQIPQLGPNMHVQTDLNFTGSLDEMLQRMVGASPLEVLRQSALGQARATGETAVRLQLDVPLAAPQASTVQGQVLLTGNTLRPAPGWPALSQARGLVHFSEHGFALSAVQARWLGGEVQVEGGTIPVPGALTLQSTFKSALLPTPNPPLSTQRPRLRVQGQFTAQGLRQAGQEDSSSEAFRKLAALARQMEGGARYEAEFGLNEGAPEFLLRTDLRGLALSLPAPLRKSADQTLPVRLQLERRPPRDQEEANLVLASAGPRGWHDRLSLEVGRLLQLRYERVKVADQERPRVLRGLLRLDLTAQDPLQPSRDALLLPDAGVRAVLRLGTLDVNAWLDAARQGVDARTGLAQAPRVANPAPSPSPAAADPAWLDYLPTQWRMLGDRVQLSGQSLSDLEIDVTRDGGTWRAQLASQEASGVLSYRMPSGMAQDGGVADRAGYLHARLSRLVLKTKSAEAEAPKTVDPGAATEENRDIPSLDALDLPALDIVIEQLQWGNQSLGQLEVEAGHGAAPAALNVATQAGPSWVWQLRRLRLVLPDGEFTAQGQWPAVSTAPAAPAAAAGPGTASIAPRRSSLDFQLTIKDSGRLLARLGKPGLIEGGAGRMQGQLAWNGVPWRPSLAALDGSLKISIERGQFLKVEPGAARLLGVLSLQSLPRRLMLDFRDFFSDGFSFDFVRGNVRLRQGVARTNNLQMKGVVAAVLMSGQADLRQETQDLRVVIVPEINAGTASLIAAWINPAVGLTTFLAQAMLRRPAIAAATQEYHVTGNWVEPQVEKVDRQKQDETTAPSKDASQDNASEEEPTPSTFDTP